MTEISYFDGHCDTIERCLRTGESLLRNRGHIDLARAAVFRDYVQVFALYWPDPQQAPAMLPRLHDRYLDETARAAGRITRCKTAADICAAGTACRALLSIEGGELLDCDPAMLETAADWGVRMINLTWNHANLLSGAHASDAARGLTARGRAFVREAQRLGILIDVSHLSARGFWDLIGCTERPIIASHSDCSAVFPHSRSLTDDQIRAVAETGGVIGVNFYSEFVGAPATMDCLVAHVEHLLAHGGEDAVAIGADFDGCDTVCGGIAGLQDVPKLWQALQRRGYPEALLQRIFFGNWLRLL